MPDFSDFAGPNEGYVLEQYERFQRDPEAIDPGWRAYFAEFTPPAVAGGTLGGAHAPDLAAIVGAHELAEAIRARGHTEARLSPLSAPEGPDHTLRPDAHGLSEEALTRLPAAAVRGAVSTGAASAAEAVQRLRDLYSGTVGFEFDHIANADEREWLRDQVEAGEISDPLPGEERRALLQRLSQVEGFERYLHRSFFGQKRFSIEGTDLLVPMLDAAVEAAARRGAVTVVIGMAHRGRLNVLTHVLGKPYEMMLSGFVGAKKGKKKAGGSGVDDLSQDVKYHMGWRDRRRVDGREVTVTLAPNPSHLEFVDPVVVGMTRAAQDTTDHTGIPDVSFSSALAILVHGDTAFPGQGVVAETLNMSCLRGYTVGGTVHLIANNQIGFTTDPEESRSTRYSSDLAKGFEIPVVHVNADAADACVRVVRLALAYRERFQKDFVVDLVGYRRWGHNEGDEPAFTQPRLYDAIREHP
nr:thiamine pyrophosphate-dependent enzyme [Gemmatimonadota bacterium]